MFLATLLNYMDRQALSQTATELKEHYGIGDARYGIIEGSFSEAFAVGSILFGFIVDRFGPRLVYPVVLLGWSVAGLITPLISDPNVTDYFVDPDDPASGPYHWLLLCRTMLGLFEAGHWPCALITARQILNSKDRPLGNGILQSGASVGAVLIPPYVWVLRHLGYDWQVVFWTIGAVGLLWVPIWLVLVRAGDLDSPSALEKEAEDDVCVPPVPSTPFNWLSFLRMYFTLFIVIVGLALSWQVLRAWLPKYLKESQGFSADATDWIVAGYYTAAGLGCMVSGFPARWLVGRGMSIHSARLAGFAVFAAITLSAAMVPVVGGGWAGVVLLTMAATGIICLHPYYYALTQELPTKHMGSLSGFLAAAGWGVVGYVQKKLGVHIEATRSYDAAFVLVGVAPLLGLFFLLIFWKPIKETAGEPGALSGSSSVHQEPNLPSRGTVEM
jgi:MFS transporter, ACS family, hexuronate transporter